MIAFTEFDEAKSVEGYSLSAVFDFAVLTNYTKVKILPPEKFELIENRPLYAFLTGNLERMNCKAFRLHYGPVSSGIWEAGAFEVLSYGERILEVVPLLRYKNRGMEKRVEGMDVEKATCLVEKFCGTFSSSYSTAYCIAVEKIAGFESEKLDLARTLAVELERAYNHIHTIYRLALAASQKVAVSHLSALEEELLRINYKIFGHRYIFGFSRPGYVKLKSVDVKSRIKNVLKEFDELVEELSVSKIFIDRLHGTAKISRSEAVKLDTIGVAARASGLKRDARMLRRFEPIKIVEDGDSLARTVVRFEEVKNSLRTALEIIDSLSLKEISNEVKVKSGEAISFVESPPGDLVLYLKIKDGRVEKLRVRGASEVNFLSFAKSVVGNIFTDYPFALESFGLSFADASR